MVANIGLIILGFLFGSISTGVILARWKAGIDLRQAGSGNIGATNVARVLGKGMGALTMVGDIVKGTIPVVLARQFTNDASIMVALTALAAFLGHLYSPFLKFKGGKGVAVALGAFLAISPLVALIVFLVWAGVVAGTRIVSVGSLAAALALPVALGLLLDSPAYLSLAILVCILIFYRHRDNIRRLMAGTETRFGLSSG